MVSKYLTAGEEHSFIAYEWRSFDLSRYIENVPVPDITCNTVPNLMHQTNLTTYLDAVHQLDANVSHLVKPPYS